MEKKCDDCGELKEIRNLGKINGKRLCKTCRVKVRKNHREETIEITGIKRDLNKLKQQIDKERGYGRRCYEKRVGHKVGEKNYRPEIKGSTFAKQKEKSNAYINFLESQTLLKMLMNRGMDFKEAKERVNQLIISQELIRKEFQSKNKSEEQIKNKQNELLEELWNY